MKQKITKIPSAHLAAGAAQIFDQQRVRAAFDRAADTYQQAAVLQNEVCRRLLEKLEIVKISPQTILDAGTGTGSAVPALFTRYKKAQLVTFDLSENMLQKAALHGSFFRSPQAVCGDIEQLPFADNTFDLVFSSLSLQWCNDLNAALLEAKRVLKPGGLFVFSTFGPDTLKELRHSWAQVDGVNRDGANSGSANHVNRFIDMHDIGDALLSDGFAEPVMEAEILTVTYRTVDELMHDLKAIGANVTADISSQAEAAEGQATAIKVAKGLGGKSVLQNVRQSYEKFRQEGLLPASYEVIYGHAWKPEHEATKNRADNQQFVKFKP